MSKEMLEFTGFESRLKGYGVEIIAEAPDDQIVSVFVKGEDIREFYECNPASFMEKWGDNAKELCSLFTAMNGLKVIDND